MNALPFIIGALLVYAIAYRFYSAFLAAKVLSLSDERVTAAVRHENGHDYVPMSKYVAFGHHFAAIAGAGPLIGPVLAAQFGFLPGFLWILIGACLGGAVHDFVILVASTRNDGLSIDNLAKKYITGAAGVTTAVAALFIIVCALAGLAVAVVNALAESPWGTFTIAATIPIALFIGLYMFRLRPGRIAEGSIIGVALVLAAVVGGRFVAAQPWAHLFVLDKPTLSIILPIYGLVASVLPVWLLLAPRDYLSSYMKIGTISIVGLGVILVMPTLKMPMITQFVSGGGPIVKGPVWPFVCITIMCGAISGFHALIGSGTTPKMVAKESHLRFIGYGAMLTESFVSLMALVAATALAPGDYFAINVPPEVFAKLGMATDNLAALSKLVEEDLRGRTGGAVCMAVGMAQIFSSLPGMKTLTAFWYHFMIMFEALFILTTIDAGSRVLRYIAQELLGRRFPTLGRHDHWPSVIGISVLTALLWGWLLYHGDVRTIWPMFGVANQLLAAVALAIGTVIILTESKRRVYALTTALPFAFVIITTAWAGVVNIFSTYYPMTADPKTAVPAWANIVLTVVMLALVIVLLVETARKVRALLR
ncbi:MAG: carbon starvation protein A [Deltaproteobacteria bacterium]|nr:carbon starvation protein A [Deltaproteobacteria bacterium]